MRSRSSRRQAGQSTVEFALSGLLFFMILAGVLDVGRAVWYFSSMQEGVREATRYAIVHGSKASTQVGPGNTGGLTTIVKNYAGSGLNTSNLAVTSTYPDGNNVAGSRVTVTVTYPFQPFMGLSIGAFTISASSTRTIVY